MSPVAAYLLESRRLRDRAAPGGVAPCVVTFDYWDLELRLAAQFLIEGRRFRC